MKKRPAEPTPKCGEMGEYDEHRPHKVFARTEKGAFFLKRKERVTRRYHCHLEPGHEGAHHDTYNQVQWS